MIDLSERVALVTGGASGMGAATARRLAGLGATVVVADVDTDGAASVVRDLGSGRPHRWQQLDVSDSEQWTEAVGTTVARLGRIDVVHLNAGVMTRPPAAPLGDPREWLTEAGYRRVVGVNVDGVVLGLLATLPHLETRGGDVVVTASIAGLTALDFDPFYALSKHALVGFVRSLRGLARRGVRVNAICPGGVDTAIVPDDIRSRATLAPPSYIADAVVQVLASGRSGTVWVALDEASGVWAIDEPDLRGGATPPG